MRLQGRRRSTFNTSKCCALTSRCRRLVLPTAAAPERRIWLLRGPRPPLLLLLSLLLSSLQRPTWSSQVETNIDFDLAPNSFDDQYQGCSTQVMEELNQGDYFIEEMESHKNYSRAWHQAHLTWLNQPKVLPKNMTTAHAVAILVYTLNNNIRSDFTKAMASAGRSSWQYKHSFYFKYLHYYLTSAIQLLREEINKNGTLCYEVYHEVKDAYLKAHLNATIRFGQFLSTSLLNEEAREIENQTVFTIFTCLGAPVEDFSLKKEILVPPYELFKVVNMSYHPRGSWLQLQSTGNLSTYNCHLLKASSKKFIPAPLVTASLSIFTSVIISSKSRV
ncbi:ecto-ADP-ribosyltransferase 4 [Trichechus manatus latirostris]|uniref:NAD(P)(+)--arginine ADP-ribosyltransferase n=1 Tax=Trichechus manatus latirostris TaxID=127582 RepID=A0A2Y9E563_TRIMA|nr:ecto-ADP-ribosyltransferase 4 [Trichechus manatus latirostris]